MNSLGGTHTLLFADGTGVVGRGSWSLCKMLWNFSVSSLERLLPELHSSRSAASWK